MYKPSKQEHLLAPDQTSMVVIVISSIRLATRSKSIPRSTSSHYFRQKPSVRPWTHGFGIKHRSMAGAMWKRRLRRARQAEARIAEAFLLPSHWLKKQDSPFSSAYKVNYLDYPPPHTPVPRLACRCYQNSDTTYPQDKDLPSYESCPPTSSLPPNTSRLSPRPTPSRLYMSPRMSPRYGSNLSIHKPACTFTTNGLAVEVESGDGWVEEQCPTHEPLFTSPTPLLLPNTKATYHAPHGSSSMHCGTGPEAGRVCSGNCNESDLGTLPSPLQKAIHRLAELAGIVDTAEPLELGTNLLGDRHQDTPLPSARPSPGCKAD